MGHAGCGVRAPAHRRVPAILAPGRTRLPGAGRVGLSRNRRPLAQPVAGSAIYITDEPKQIQKKINKAYCPPDDVVFNPVLNWAKTLHFQLNRGPLQIDRPAQYGGPVSFATYAELEAAYAAQTLFAGDLKAGVAASLVRLLEPVRAHFAAPERAAMLAEIQKVKLTR